MHAYSCRHVIVTKVCNKHVTYIHELWLKAFGGLNVHVCARTCVNVGEQIDGVSAFFSSVVSMCGENTLRMPLGQLLWTWVCPQFRCRCGVKVVFSPCLTSVLLPWCNRLTCDTCMKSRTWVGRSWAMEWGWRRKVFWGEGTQLLF